MKRLEIGLAALAFGLSVYFAYMLLMGGSAPWNNFRYPLLVGLFVYLGFCGFEKRILFKEILVSCLESPRFSWWITAIALVVFSRIKVQQFFAGEISGVDFSHIDYAIWSTTQGKWMEIPILLPNDSFLNFFGNHFSPILLVPVAVRWVWDSPLASLVVHGASLAAAIPVLWALARQYLPALAASSLILIYVFCGSVASTLQFDIHQESFFPLAWGLFFLGIRGRLWQLFLGAALVLSIKEDAGIYLSWACLVIAVFQKEKRLALTSLSLLSLAFTFLALKVWMPMHQPEQTTVPYYFTMWSNYGSNFQEVIWKMATHPHWVLSDIFLNKALYKNLLPWAFVPFTHLAGLVALAPLAVSSTATGVQKGFGLYYGIILVPIFFYVSCVALEKRKNRQYWIGLGLVMSLFVGGSYLKFPSKLDFYSEIESAVEKTVRSSSETIWVQSGLLPFLPYETRWKRVDGLSQLIQQNRVEAIFFEGLEKSTVVEDSSKIDQTLKNAGFLLVESSGRWKKYRKGMEIQNE